MAKDLQPSGVDLADSQSLLKELENEREFLEQYGTCPRSLSYVLRGWLDSCCSYVLKKYRMASLLFFV